MIRAALAFVGAMWFVAAQGARADTFRKGPYWMDLQPTSIALMAELDRALPLSIELRSERGTSRSLSSPAALFHELQIGELDAATRYDYRATAGETTVSGTFRTGRPREQTRFSLLAYGDNRTDHAAHARVVAQMVRERDVDAVMHTGDFVARGDDPGDWEAFFDIAAPLLRSTPLFPSLGNHELMYRAEIGLDAYLRYMRAPASTSGTELYYAADHGNTRLIALNSEEAFDRTSRQLAWLRTTLEATAADPTIEHTFVFLHHGPLSSGPHSENARMHLGGAVELLRTHRVSLILSGHDHLYERGEADGLKYVVTGGGGAPLYYRNRRKPYQLAFDPRHHYVRVDVDGPRVRVTARDANGEVFDQCEFVGDGPWDCGGRNGAVGPRGAGRIVEVPGAAWKDARRSWWVIAGVPLAILAVLALAYARWRARRERTPRRRE